MQEGVDIPPLTPLLEKPEIGKPTRFWTPLKQRVVATALGAAIGIPAGIAAWNNKHNPERLPTSKPIVQTINSEDIKMYPREFNNNIREWEGRVNELLKVGSEINVQQFEINVKPGSEPVKLRSFPEFDLSSGEPQSHIQAELPPGFHRSFYGFTIEGEATNVPNDNTWFVIFLNAPTEGEAPILAFLNAGRFTSESVNRTGNNMPIKMIGRDSEGFPAGIDADGNGIRIGYLALPSAPKPPVY